MFLKPANYDAENEILKNSKMSPECPWKTGEDTF